jgi:D-glycero-alpha-D-manno-heptose-7-phosphate kinase
MIITKAPLRISFLGGGTDYPEYFLTEGGAVLATAIDKFAYITANHFHSELFDYNIRLAYRKVELVRSINDIEHTPFRETLRRCGVARDVELNYFADLPAFTGLGSSSSFTVALLQALHAYCGRFRSGLDLAYEAIYLERHVFGDKVGCQDQVLAAVGGLNMIEFRAEDDILVHRIALSPARLRELESYLMLFFTGIKRSAAKVAGEQIARVNDNRSALLLMRGMVDEGLAILTSGGPLSRFGELLHESWKLKRSLGKGVTCSTIDDMYTAAKESGALGGKLVGAGGGGFLLLFVPPDRQLSVTAALDRLPAVQIRTSASGCQVLGSDLNTYHLEREPLLA